jgi:hypothetical protein
LRNTGRSNFKTQRRGVLCSSGGGIEQRDRVLGKITGVRCPLLAGGAHATQRALTGSSRGTRHVSVPADHSHPLLSLSPFPKGSLSLFPSTILFLRVSAIEASSTIHSSPVPYMREGSPGPPPPSAARASSALLLVLVHLLPLASRASCGWCREGAERPLMGTAGDGSPACGGRR